VCERIVRSQLLAHLAHNGFQTDKQHGFRPGRSTVTALLTTLEEWKRLLQQHDHFYLIFLDFSKAFDVVDHGILKSKLAAAGIGGQAIKWLSDYLDRRSMSVIIGGVESSRAPVHSGVIQGSSLGPALFSFFSDDIPSCVSDGASVGLFADDVKLYAPVKDQLKISSDNVLNWSTSNSLPLAPDKSIFMIIRRRRALTQEETLSIGETQVRSVTVARDLGVQISDDLECSTHVKHIAKKAFRISNLILRILKTKKMLLYRKAFYSLVLPILEYCSVVWNPFYAKDVNLVESVLRRFTKRAQRKCGLPHECYSARLARWNMPSLEIRRLQIDLIMVFKIMYRFVDLDRDKFFRITMTENELKIYPHTVVSSQRNNTQMNSLAGRTYKIWNQLPLIIKNSISVSSFKYRIKRHSLEDKFDSKLNW
jgi:hypothetical protein